LPSYSKKLPPIFRNSRSGTISQCSGFSCVSTLHWLSISKNHEP
jgi:hypothetical protein